MLNQYYIIKVGVAHLFKFVEKTFMGGSHANSKICECFLSQLGCGTPVSSWRKLSWVALKQHTYSLESFMYTIYGIVSAI